MKKNIIKKDKKNNNIFNTLININNFQKPINKKNELMLLNVIKNIPYNLYIGFHAKKILERYNILLPCPFGINEKETYLNYMWYKLLTLIDHNTLILSKYEDKYTIRTFKKPASEEEIVNMLTCNIFSITFIKKFIKILEKNNLIIRVKLLDKNSNKKIDDSLDYFIINEDIVNRKKIYTKRKNKIEVVSKIYIKNNNINIAEKFKINENKIIYNIYKKSLTYIITKIYKKENIY